MIWKGSGLPVALWGHSCPRRFYAVFWSFLVNSLVSFQNSLGNYNAWAFVSSVRKQSLQLFFSWFLSIISNLRVVFQPAKTDCFDILLSDYHWLLRTTFCIHLVRVLKIVGMQFWNQVHLSCFSSSLLVGGRDADFRQLLKLWSSTKLNFINMGFGIVICEQF